MSKLGMEYENPLDALILKLTDFLCPYFKEMNLTPNDLTTFSIFSALLSVYAIYKGHIILGCVFFIASYIFDCMDGHYARTYGMTTKFGDYYDHISDAITIFAILSVIIHRYGKEISVFTFVSLVLALLFSSMHFGCLEKFYDKEEEGESLSYFKNMCKVKDKETMKMLGIFSSNTTVIVTCLIILYLEYRKNKK
jgi:phosphatidylglycerophosphate synthase